MILSYENFIDNASDILANSEASGYPVDNVQDYQLAKVYRSTGVSGEWVKFDFGSAKDVKGVFVAGHNITSGATVKVQANSSDSWTSPPVDESMTYGDVIYKIFSSDQSYQWWRVTIDDSGNGDGYIEIGHIEICKLADFGDIIKADFPFTIERTDTVKWSLTGQVFGDIGIAIELLTLSLPHINNTEKSLIEDVFEDKGKYKPMFVILYEDDISTYGIKYMVFNDDLSFNHIFGGVWNCNIALREAK